MPSVWPRDDLDKVSPALPLMGGFWTDIWPARSDAIAWGRVATTLMRAPRDSALYLARILSRPLPRDLPAIPWARFAVRLGSAASRPTRIGDAGLAIGAGWPIGQESATGLVLADGIRPDSILLDRPARPTRMLIGGYDFELDESAGAPAIDPALFRDEGAWARSPAGDAVGWAWRESDAAAGPWDIFGAPLRIPAVADPALIDAHWDLLAGGPSREAFLSYLAAALGTRICLGQGEVVELLWDGPRARVAFTNLAAYRAAPIAEFAAAPGDPLRFGESPFDAVRVAWLSDGAPDWLERLAIDSSLASGGFAAGGIVFGPAEAAARIGSAGDGGTTFAFDAGPGSDAFFAEWEAKARRMGARTPAMATLDTDGPVSPSDLPQSVVPVRWACETLLGRNAVIVQVRPAALERPRIDSLNRLRELSSPHGAVIFLLVAEAASGADAIASGASAEIGPGLAPGEIGNIVQATVEASITGTTC